MLREKESMKLDMENDFKVSIITVSYNAVKTIEQTIQSVVNQTYNNIEYLVIDGQSTDGTQDIIERYKDSISYYISEPDNGIYDAMNKGISYATGDIVGIINSDDWYETDAIEKVVNCFNHTSADVVYGEIWLINEKGDKERQTRKSLIPPHPSMLVRRDIYQKYGKFDLSYKIAADYELMLRFISKGVSFEHMDDILANFRVTGISNEKGWECAKETYEIELKYLDKCSRSFLDRNVAEEKYNKAKLLYISQNNPERIYRILNKKFETLENGVVIFGAGTWGRELYAILRNCNIPVKFFVDNEEIKWGLQLEGIQIFSPEILKNYNGYVLVAVKNYQKDICRQLTNLSNSMLRWNTLEELWDKVIGC